MMECDSCASGATIAMPEIISFLEYLNLHDAIKACVEGTTQSQAHIKPLHRHFAMRLVIEGGFMPREITPCPPFTHERRKKENLLLWNEAMGSKSERTVIGGVKTKQIDIVVTKPSLGPVLALSFKATQNAFRNLTNRMEEAVGDCTNIHLRYPSLVYGFYHAIVASRSAQIGLHRFVRSNNDVSVGNDDLVVSQVLRYIRAIEALSDRSSQWADPSGYEAIAVHMVESDPLIVGKSFAWTEEAESRLNRERFLEKLLRIYDFRYPFMAESMPETRRVEWSPRSPLFEHIVEKTKAPLEEALGYPARLSSE